MSTKKKSNLGDVVLAATRVSSTVTREPASILEFVESPWGLGATGLKLFPVQKVILKAHYGIPLDDKEKIVPVWGRNWKEGWRRENLRYLTEAEYLRYAFDEGRSNIEHVEEGHERRELLLSVGRRSGKSFMASCISAYEAYKLLLKYHPQRYYGLPDSETIQLVSVATGEKQALGLFNSVSGHFSKCDFFHQYMANNTQSYIKFQTPYDIEKFGTYSSNQNPATASIRITFSSCVAKGLRGAGNMIIILDEFAHFTDGSQSSAETVYTAIAPSTSAFTQKDPQNPSYPLNPEAGSEGRIICISSPLGKQGYFYELFQIGMSGGSASRNMLTIQAPTWEVNPGITPTEFAKYYAKDAVTFFTEYGAEFSDRTRGWIEDPQDLRACIDLEARPRRSAPSRVAHVAGLDFALVGDASAIAIGHLDNNQKIILDVVDQIKAGEGKYADRDRLEFDEVADWVLDYTKRFYITEGMFDQWAGIPFEQALSKRGLGQFTSTFHEKNLKSQIWKNFKDMLIDERLQFYNYPLNDNEEFCDYLTELLELQAEVSKRYVIDVHAPEAEGKHDDRSDAIARMIWLASNKMGKTLSFGRSAGGPAKRNAAGNSRAAFGASPTGFGNLDLKRQAPKNPRGKFNVGKGRKW